MKCVYSECCTFSSRGGTCGGLQAAPCVYAGMKLSEIRESWAASDKQAAAAALLLLPAHRMQQLASQQHAAAATAVFS